MDKRANLGSTFMLPVDVPTVEDLVGTIKLRNTFLIWVPVGSVCNRFANCSGQCFWNGPIWQSLNFHANALLEKTVVSLCMWLMFSVGGIVHTDVHVVLDWIHERLEFLVAMDDTDVDVGRIVPTGYRIDGGIEVLRSLAWNGDEMTSSN